MVDLTRFMPLPAALAIYIGAAVGTAFFMEYVAFFLHKHVMHGFGWYLHEDHHRPTKGKFEKNDSFAVFFSMISFLLIFFGIQGNFNLFFWIGAGIAAYGVGYFLFHDVIFHKRIKIKYRPKGGYLLRIIKAHAHHHQTSNAKGPGESFGFLYAPKKFAE